MVVALAVFGFGLALAAPAGAASCGGFSAHRSHRAILSLDPRARAPRVIGNRAFVPGEDQAAFRRYARGKRGFLALAPWVRRDGPRSVLRGVGNSLAPESGSRLENDYLETALVADLPVPVDRRRRGCAEA